MNRSVIILICFFLLIVTLPGCRQNADETALQSLIVANDAIMKSDQIIQCKVNGNYNYLKMNYILRPGKMKEYFDKGEIVRKKSEELIDYVNQLKWELISLVIHKELETVERLEESSLKNGVSFLSQIDDAGNYKTPTSYLFDEIFSGNGPSNILQLKREIISYKQKMIDILGPRYSNSIRSGLEVEKEIPDMEGEESQSWEMANFYNKSLAADVLLLNSIILEIRNIEADVIAILFSICDTEGYVFDKVSAVVVPKSNYVFSGEEYEATISVSAYNSHVQPKLIVGAGVDTTTLTVIGRPTIIEGENGVVKYKVRTNGVGERRYGGVIEYISRSGVAVRYPFSSSYHVVENPK